MVKGPSSDWTSRREWCSVVGLEDERRSTSPLHRSLDLAEGKIASFEKALVLDSEDCMIHLNYAVVLYNNGFREEAIL